MSDLDRAGAALGVNFWSVRSFRAKVLVDFDEYGNILKVEVSDPVEQNRSPASTTAAQPDNAGVAHE